MTTTDLALSSPELRRKIMGCWLGKAVGGTLGQTFEGLRGPLDAPFYHPVPTTMVPNDDLDLQVLFACVLSASAEPVVDRHALAAAWAKHVLFPWNEYGVAMRNYAEGIRPPHTGSFDNWFTAGEGAAIRSELWACLAPGDPDRAARYAYEDACFDHAGVGIDAAVFLARLQSAAFTGSDPDQLLDIAVAGLAQDSDIRAVVSSARRLARSGIDWRDARQQLENEFANSDFTDVRVNTGYVVLGWLIGTDFSERIVITNGCGSDTDSTTASLGSLLGILDPAQIDQRWLDPIGSSLVLSPEISGITPPPTLDEFTDLVTALRPRLVERSISSPSSAFAAQDHAIPVGIAWFNTTTQSWAGRDLSELPPPGTPAPQVAFTDAELPGTWVRMPETEFADRILLVRYRVHPRGRRDVRLMLNSTEDYRVWLDGDFLHAAQGSRVMFPAPHMAPVGQFIDFSIDDSEHELVVAIRRPRPGTTAEWVIALTEGSTQLWIENAFRPSSLISHSSKDVN